MSSAVFFELLPDLGLILLVVLQEKLHQTVVELLRSRTLARTVGRELRKIAAERLDFKKDLVKDFQDKLDSIGEGDLSFR